MFPFRRFGALTACRPGRGRNRVDLTAAVTGPAIASDGACQRTGIGSGHSRFRSRAASSHCSFTASASRSASPCRSWRLGSVVPCLVLFRHAQTIQPATSAITATAKAPKVDRSFRRCSGDRHTLYSTHPAATAIAPASSTGHRLRRFTPTTNSVALNADRESLRCAGRSDSIAWTWESISRAGARAGETTSIGDVGHGSRSVSVRVNDQPEPCRASRGIEHRCGFLWPPWQAPRR